MTNEEFLAEFGHLAAAPGGVERLRRLILNLAVLGRFAPKGSRGPEDGWRYVPLEEVSTNRGGYWGAAERTVESATAVRVLRNGDVRREGTISGAADRWFSVKEAEKAAVEVGDLVVSSSGDVGKVWLCDTPGFHASNFVRRIRISDPGLSAPFLDLWLRSPSGQAAMLRHTSGMTIANLRFKSFVREELPLPPLVEQESIVARVDELMALCDEIEQSQKATTKLRAETSRSALAAIVESDRSDPDTAVRIIQDHLRLCLEPGEGALEVLSYVRQAILDLAVRGRLAVYRGGLDQPGPRYSQSRDGQLEQAGQSLPAPSGWEVCLLGEMGTWITGRTPPAKDSSNFGSDLPFFTPGDLGNRGFLKGAARGLSTKGAERVRILRPPAVMVTCISSIGSIGKVGLVNVPCATNQQITSLEVDTARADPEFVAYSLLSSIAQKQLLARVSQTTIPIINKKSLTQIALALPPLEEQRRIVARVDELMALCDQIESALTTERELASEFADSAVADLLAEHA